jgi:hypothetical protein
MTLAEELTAAITKSSKEHGYSSTQIDINHGYFVDDAGDNVHGMSVTASRDLREVVDCSHACCQWC